MPQRGLSFGSGFAQGVASMTDLWLRQRLVRQAAAEEQLRQTQNQDRTFFLNRQLAEEEQARNLATQEAESGRTFEEQYGLPRGATLPLPPGTQGPTPAGPVDIAAAIQGSPKFLRERAVEKMETDEQIRQEAARQRAQAAGENVMSLSDRIRLGADIQRAYGDAFQAAEAALDPYAEGSKEILAAYQGNRQLALQAIAGEMAKAPVQAILSLIPPDLRAGMEGITPGVTLPTQASILADLESELARETDVVKMRAKFEAAKVMLRDMGSPLSPDQEALYEGALAKAEAALPSLTSEKGPTGPTLFQRLRGRTGGQSGGWGGGEEGPLAAVKPATAAAQPTAPPQPKTGAKTPGVSARANVKTLNPVQVRLQGLQEREARLLEQARQDLALGGAVRREIDDQLRQVQSEITRLGGTPQPLAVPPNGQAVAFPRAQGR